MDIPAGAFLSFFSAATLFAAYYGIPVRRWGRHNRAPEMTPREKYLIAAALGLASLSCFIPSCFIPSWPTVCLTLRIVAAAIFVAANLFYYLDKSADR
jgi:hypothetical protein